MHNSKKTCELKRFSTHNQVTSNSPVERIKNHAVRKPAMGGNNSFTEGYTCIERAYGKNGFNYLQKAVQIFSHNIKKDEKPENSWRAYMARAQALNELGIFIYAAANLEKIVKITESGSFIVKDTIVFRNIRGFTLLGLGRYEDSMNDFLKAIEYEQHSITAHSHLGTVQRKFDDKKAASEHYLLALRTFRSMTNSRSPHDYAAAIRAEKGLELIGQKTNEAYTQMALKKGIACKRWVDSLT